MKEEKREYKKGTYFMGIEKKESLDKKGVKTEILDNFSNNN